jgi:hypothetical protein
MKASHVIALVFVLGILFLLLSIVSWTNAYVVQEEVSPGQKELVAGISFASPFIIGILIVVVVFLLILIAVND